MIKVMTIASGSAGNCYRITDGTTSILIECGIPIKDIRSGLGYQLSEISACLISHEHKDHCVAIKDILKLGIDCYMSQGTKEALNLSGHRVHVIKNEVRIGTWRVMPFRTKHDSAEPIGFLLISGKYRLLFATDTTYIPIFHFLSHVMIECNYDPEILKQNNNIPPTTKQRIRKAHFSIVQAKQYLQSIDLRNVRGIWLIHLSNENSHELTFKRTIQEITGKPVYIAPP